jgi:hypothetical protein
MSEAPNMEPSREPATAEAPATLTPALDQSERIRRLTPVKSGRGHWRSYTVASGLALNIIAARVALDPVLGREHDRHLFLLPAVMLAAWVGGLGPGCVATILCTGALSWIWNARGATAFPVVTFDVVLFFPVGIAVCALIESLRVARSHAESARAARDRGRASPRARRPRGEVRDRGREDAGGRHAARVGCPHGRATRHGGCTPRSAGRVAKGDPITA